MPDLTDGKKQHGRTTSVARAGKLARPRGDSHLKREKRSRRQKLTHAIMNNSITIVLFALFVVCIFAQSFAGWRLENVTLAAHGQALIGYWRNMCTGAFLEGLASNWQAAFLQLASLILFSGFLYQRGAPHSRDPLKAKSRRDQHEETRRFSWYYRGFSR